MKKSKLMLEIKILTTLIELNMKDFHVVVNQRDRYYAKYCRVKAELKRLKNQRQKKLAHKKM